MPIWPSRFTRLSCWRPSHSFSHDQALSGTGKAVAAATDRLLPGSRGDLGQVLRKERQRLRPGVAVRIGTVTLTSPVHEGVSSPRVRVELVYLAMLGEFGVKLAHVRRRRVGVLLTKQSKYRAMDLCSALKGRWALAPGDHDVAPIVGHGSLQVWIGCRHEISYPAAHAEANDP